jgi:hypothetical protein
MRQQWVADSGSMGWLRQTAYKIKYFKNKRIDWCGLRPTRLTSFGAARFSKGFPLGQAVCWQNQLAVKQQIEAPARGVTTPLDSPDILLQECCRFVDAPFSARGSFDAHLKKGGKGDFAED